MSRKQLPALVLLVLLAGAWYAAGPGHWPATWALRLDPALIALPLTILADILVMRGAMELDRGLLQHLSLSAAVSFAATLAILALWPPGQPVLARLHSSIHSLADQVARLAAALPTDLRRGLLGSLRASAPQDWANRAMLPSSRHLILPDGLYNEVQRIADRFHITDQDACRLLFTLGITVTRIEESPGAALILREGNRDRQIVLH